MLKNFSRSLILSATLLLGVVTPGQAILILDERASGRYLENPIGPYDLLTPINNLNQTDGPNQEPNELLWSPKSTRIVTK